MVFVLYTIGGCAASRYDFEDVKTRILEENLAVEVSNEPLRLKVYAPHLHNVTLVDLPGYITAIKPGMSRTVPQQIDGTEHQQACKVVEPHTCDPFCCAARHV